MGFLGGRLMILWRRIGWLRFGWHIMMDIAEVGDPRGTFKGYTYDSMVQNVEKVTVVEDT